MEEQPSPNAEPQQNTIGHIYTEKTEKQQELAAEFAKMLTVYVVDVKRRLSYLVGIAEWGESRKTLSS